MSEMIDRLAKAMQQRAREPLGNIESLEPVLVGSLGDAWSCLARAAIAAMREPTAKMEEAGDELDDWGVPSDPGRGNADALAHWTAMINEALK